MIRSSINFIQFQLRSRLLGKIALRAGLPPARSSEERGQELGFYRFLLERVLDSELGSQVDSVIDVGCSSWSYVGALAEFFPNAQLTGVEVDGWRRYWNLYRRMDQAQAYAQQVSGLQRKAQVLALDFRHFKAGPKMGRTVFTFFFPFVSENPCLGWGLPSQYSDFVGLLQHSRQLVEGEAESIWVSAHQGEWEAELAREAYLKAGFFVEAEVRLLAEEVRGLWPSEYPTFLFRAARGLG